MKNMTTASATSDRRNKAGLTLIELIVVLFILAAIAGIAVASFPGFQKLTHGSSSANSIRNVESVLGARLLTGGALGDQFDALNIGTDIPDYIAESGGTGGLGTTALDADSLGALQDLGITTLFPPAFADRAALIAADANATLSGHDYLQASAITLATTTPVASLLADSANAVALDYNLRDETTGLAAPPDVIFAFGLGERSSLVGLNGAFKEAPVHTPGEGSAVTTYGRYALLVGYNAAAGGEPAEAFFIGATCIDDGENFNNISNNLGEYFEGAAGGGE